MPLSGDAKDGPNNVFGDLNLAVTGLGVEYPPFKLQPEDLNTLCARHYPDSPA